VLGGVDVLGVAVGLEAAGLEDAGHGHVLGVQVLGQDRLLCG
jgi:hypothetical protein